jgi:hypothetical protein
MFGDLGDIEHPDNQNADFRDGYAEGICNDLSLADRNNAITTEWRKRGQPDSVNASFEVWKRGYWVGRIEVVSVKPSIPRIKKCNTCGELCTVELRQCPRCKKPLPNWTSADERKYQDPLEHGCTNCRACESSHCRICDPCGKPEPRPYGISSKEQNG